MKTRMLVLVLTLALGCLSGCALSSYEVLNTEDYPTTRKIFDVTFGWKSALTDSGINIDGYARNNRYPIISDLELRVSLIDKSGREKTGETFFFIPSRLPQDDKARFSVSLKASPQPGDKLRFFYRYQGLEGRDQAINWMNSFEVPVAE